MTGEYDWKPDAEQLRRIGIFEQWLLAFLAEHEAKETLNDLCSAVGRVQKSENEAPDPFLIALHQAPFADDLERHLADYYFYPAAVQWIPNRRVDPQYKRGLARAADFITEHGVCVLGENYTFAQALARLSFQLRWPDSDLETAQPAWVEVERENIRRQFSEEWARQDALQNLDKLFEHFYRDPFLAPRPYNLALLTLKLAKTRAQAGALLQLITDPNVRMLDADFAPAHCVQNGQCPGTMSSARYLGIGSNAHEMVALLARFDLLQAETVLALLEMEPIDEHRLLYATLSGDPEDPRSAFQQVSLDWIYQRARPPATEAVQWLGELSDDYNPPCNLRGGRFLLAAARLMDELSDPPPAYAIASKNWDSHNKGRARAFKMLCNPVALDPGESPAEVLAALRKFKAETLRQLFRHSTTSAEWLLEALDLSQATPLFLWLRARRKTADTNQCFNSKELLSLIEAAGNQLQPLLELMRDTQLYKASLARVDAVRGIADKKLRSMLERYSQEHIRLYGLYPIRDDADLLERYTYLSQAAKSASKKFGSERTANVRDAANAGIENLAITAGFADISELEWAIDARVGGGDPSALKATFDQYELVIGIEDYKPKLDVRKEGKALKALPPALKKQAELAPLFATFEALKDQAKRYRGSVENLMIAERWLEPSKLAELARLPIAHSMLSCLVMRTKSGQSGLLSADFEALSLLDERVLPLTEAVQVAHAVQLLADGKLAAWQARVIALGLRQPFKQVFRECYVLTPAEREAGTESQRFAGRRVRTAVTGAVLGARGWRIEGSDNDFIARKRVSGEVFGELALPEVYQYLTQEEATVLDGITFRKGSDAIALSDVPAIPFSEFMRDLDLVITAGAADSDAHSDEVQAARIELVRALLPSLRLSNVTLEGTHALIRGQRASYRLHLGTAVIHVLPAGYLCVVPASSTARSPVALPFVDEDQRTSEVLAKLLMLSADHKIKDQSILDQIERRGGSGPQIS